MTMTQHGSTFTDCWDWESQSSWGPDCSLCTGDWGLAACSCSHSRLAASCCSTKCSLGGRRKASILAISSSLSSEYPPVSRRRAAFWAGSDCRAL
eukprot:148050-Rhodomonas_salina.1